MTWITFLQIAALIFEAGVVVMLVMNFWRNIKEEMRNKNLTAIGKTLEIIGNKLEESAKNKASAASKSESFEELLRRAANMKNSNPPQA